MEASGYGFRTKIPTQLYSSGSRIFLTGASSLEAPICVTLFRAPASGEELHRASEPLESKVFCLLGHEAAPNDRNKGRRTRQRGSSFIGLEGIAASRAKSSSGEPACPL
jgi:hypothetical protein